MARLPALAHSSGTLHPPSRGHLGAQVRLVLHPGELGGSGQAGRTCHLPPTITKLRCLD